MIAFLFIASGMGLFILILYLILKLSDPKYANHCDCTPTIMSGGDVSFHPCGEDHDD